MARLTGFSKFILTLLIVGAIVLGFWYFLNNNDMGIGGNNPKNPETTVGANGGENGGNGIKKGNQPSNTKPKAGKGTSSSSGDDDVIKIGVVTWGGYAGGQYFNNGFAANEESRFYKDYGFKVEFKVLDEFVPSREAWKSGEVDLLWATIDAFPTEVEQLKEFEPQVVFQADWSRGGDAVVVRRGLNKVADLKGKKIACALLTPSHSFLLWLLEAGDLKPSDVEIVEVPNAIDAAAAFKSGNVDAAVVWSPDDEDCVKSVKGSKILKSTRSASNIIADVFIAKKDYVNKNRERLKQLVEGWMKGASEINGNEVNKRKAAKILADGLSMPEDFCYKAINNVRLCTAGDNRNFFGLNPDYNGVTGEELYNKMANIYKELGYAKNPTNWRLISNSSLIRSVELVGKTNEAEKPKTFTKATKKMETEESFSNKAVTIHFPSGNASLSEDSKQIIDKDFVSIAKAFGNARIRIEGNTDSKGNRAMNVKLSKQRAQSVADFLIQEYKMDPNRFVVVGNGPDKAVADNGTEAGRSKNRRTDFHLLNE